MLIPKAKRIIDKAHLKRVAELPCCCCGLEYGVVSHHLLRAPGKYMARKSWDCYVIPLCAEHHDGLHRAGDETEYLARYGIDDSKAYALGLYYKKTKQEPFEG